MDSPSPPQGAPRRPVLDPALLHRLVDPGLDLAPSVAGAIRALSLPGLDASRPDVSGAPADRGTGS